MDAYLPRVDVYLPRVCHSHAYLGALVHKSCTTWQKQKTVDCISRMDFRPNAWLMESTPACSFSLEYGQCPCLCKISLAYILLFLIAWSWRSPLASSELQVFYGHTGAVRCGQFTPDGKAVVTGGGEGDATLKVWDPKSGSCTGTIQGHGFHEAGTP